MGQETDYFHLITQHQFALFILASLILLGLMVLIGFIFLRPSKRERKNKNED